MAQKRFGNEFQMQGVNVSRVGRKIFFSGEVNEDSIFELRKILAEIEEEDNESGYQGSAETALNGIAGILESESEKTTEEENKSIINMINTYKKNIRKQSSLDREPIHLYISSRGGDALECIGLIDEIRNMKTPIWAYTYKAMSAGFFIFIACDRRIMYKNGILLYHQVQSGTFGSLTDMIDDVNESMRIQEIIEDLTLDCTNINEEKLDEIRITKTDWCIDSDLAMELGIVDEII